MTKPEQPLPNEVDAELQSVIDGLHKADTDVDNFPQWDFDTMGSLSGTVIKVKGTIQVRRGEEVDVDLAVVETKTGTYILWESANLKEFFKEIGAGSTIVVVRRGEQKLPGAKTMKLYDAYHS